MTKQFLALARVSSREQEREGFSLEVQEEALQRYAQQQGGKIIKLFRIAETASKADERTTFRELIRLAKQQATKLDGLLFYKVDRAARNLFDYVELERLESEFGLPFISVSQPTDSSPAGRMMRRTLASMAAFYTEQQSLDVREGLARRVKGGLFVGKAPYGYRNIRRDGRSLVEEWPERSRAVRRAFELYAYHGHTLDTVGSQLAAEGLVFTTSSPRFGRSKLHNILRDRAYIGEVQHQGQWYPGTHRPIIDRPTFERVQAKLGEKVYQSHDLVFACELITCGHCGSGAPCGHPITGEQKTKVTRRHGVRRYTYYRCARYNVPGHPRIRVSEADLEGQVLTLFDKLRIGDDGVRGWFLRVLKARNEHSHGEEKTRVADLNRQLSSLREQQNRLLNLRLLDEIEAATFAAKNTELRDRIANLSHQLDQSGRSGADRTGLAVNAFELSQSLRQKWLAVDLLAKRQLLEIICLNFRLDGATLVPQMRKPFDVLAEGLSGANSRGDRI